MRAVGGGSAKICRLTLDKPPFPDSNRSDSGDAAHPSDQAPGNAERGLRMERADTASASVPSDSIKGLAQSIAKPAYRRLLTAEPVLRRAVPALIIAFLLTICVGAIVQILDHRRQTIAELSRQLEASADVLAERIDRARGGKSDF